MTRPSLLALAFLLCAPALAHAQAVFDMIDTDGNGTISREEMDAYRLANFLALDRNKDGVVDRAELLVGPGNGRKGYTPEQTQAVLAAYDHDGDTTITTEEVTEAIERLNVFSGLDTNGDGVLDRTEAEGVLDTRLRGGITGTQILDDLAQGRRTTAGFRPVEAQIVLNPFDQARVDAAGGARREQDYQSAREDGWTSRVPPSVWANPDHPGVVDLSPGTVPTAYAPYARDGYVARRVDPLRHGSMAPTLSGAVPPGPNGGVPMYTAPAHPAMAPNETITLAPLGEPFQ